MGASCPLTQMRDVVLHSTYRFLPSCETFEIADFLPFAELNVVVVFLLRSYDWTYFLRGLFNLVAPSHPLSFFAFQCLDLKTGSPVKRKICAWKSFSSFVANIRI